jgi:hypothetical protein
MPHPSDEELQVALDGEARPPVAEIVQRHLADCLTCAGRYRELERAQVEIGELLRSLDHVSPPLRAGATIAGVQRHGSRSRSLLAASIAALLLAGAAAAAVVPGSPLREYVERFFAGSQPEPRNRERGEVSETAAPQRPAESRSGIAFSPGTAVAIAFGEQQRDGSIRVRLVDGADVRVRTIGNPVPFALEGDSLWIDNSGASSSYEVSLPRLIPEARLRIAGRIVLQKEGGRISGPPPAEDGAYVLPFARTAPGSR